MAQDLKREIWSFLKGHRAMFVVAGPMMVVFAWMFVGPLADILHMAIPYLLGERNDFYHALGGFGLWAFAVVELGVLAFTAAGYAVQRRLYRDRALSGPAYVILSAILSGFLGALSCI